MLSLRQVFESVCCVGDWGSVLSMDFKLAVGGFQERRG